MGGTGPNGRIIAADVEKFIQEGGAKVEVKKAKAEQPSAPTRAVQRETPARAGGYDEQEVSNFKAVRTIHDHLC